MFSVDAKLETWKARLLDTSHRNRLLYLKPARRGQVQLVAPSADEIFSALVTQGARLTFAPLAEPSTKMAAVPTPDTPLISASVEDSGGPQDSLAVAESRAEVSAPLPPQEAGFPPALPFVDAVPGTGTLPSDAPAAGGVARLTPLTPDEESTSETEPVGTLTVGTTLPLPHLGSALYALRTQAHSVLEEQGVNVLFLSFGVLGWTDPVTHERITSPLLLVPVQLERVSVSRPFTLRMRDEDILLNPTLAFKLAQDLRLTLPRLPEDTETLTPSELFQAIRASIDGLDDWSIFPDVFLELYSFEKMVMLKDLEVHASDIAAHPLLRALAGDLTAPAPLPPLPRADELDDCIRPVETFQVLDADSSQQLAIEWSRRGVSFVIEGPPGTGKSQTIANIIGEALAQGKKVLFVSAKLAALEVVYRRLAERGLGPFCLEAHSHRAGRGVLVSELGKALYAAYPDPSPALEPLAELEELRERLNASARLLHTPIGPLNRSPFDVQAELAALDDAPDLAFELAAPGEVDSARLRAISGMLDDLAVHGDVWANLEGHPWRDIAPLSLGLGTRTDIEYHFGELLSQLRGLASAAPAVAAHLALPPPTTLRAIRHVANVTAVACSAGFSCGGIPQRKTALQRTPSPPPDWFEPGRTEQLRALAREAQAQYANYAQAHREFVEHYDESLLARDDLAALRGRLETASANPLRRLDSRVRADLRVVRAAAREAHAVHHAGAIAALTQAERLQAQRRTLEMQAGVWQAQLGPQFHAADTPWAELDSALDWVDELAALFTPDPVPGPLVALVCEGPARRGVAEAARMELESRLEALRPEWAFLATLYPDAITAFEDLPLPRLYARLATALEHLDGLEPWLALMRACDRLTALGLGGFLRSAQDARLDADQCRPAFLKRFYRLWLDRAEATHGLLNDNASLRKTVAAFCRRDLEQLDLARDRIRAKLAAARPLVAWGDAPSSEVTLLKRELARRKHFKSIRRLLAEIPNLLLALKPCLMLSPLSVSQYLASAPVAFDLVIFDEASQIPPEEAVAALVRAKQAIIAGDSQQLPPTPFFQSLGAEPEDEPEADPPVMESLLQEASIVLPLVQLLWHYRSRHESLLAFSNHHLYEDRLITFPHAGADAPGVEFIHVPAGVYERAQSRANPVEARRVVDLVAEHFASNPDASLGVVTFSRAQRAAVDAELQARLRAEPALELALSRHRTEPFFCKSLENVQGDERDVILLSIGYGRDGAGNLSFNFGPLNGADGARRLNVAITRARTRVALVSSLLPADLETARGPHRGLALLRDYMEYCVENGRAAWVPPTPTPARGNADMLLVDTVARALKARGLNVATHVGSGSWRVDLAIVDPERPAHYLLGIDLDGSTFRAARTARERERLRAAVLAQLGWRLYRLRARDWLANPTAQLDAILKTASLLETPAHAWSWPSRTLAGTNGNGQHALVVTGLAEYAETPLPRRGTPEQFYRADPRLIQDLLLQLVEQQGPLHWRAVVRRIASCWALPRVTSTVEQILDAQLEPLLARGALALRDDFLWSPLTGEVLVRQPAPGTDPRPIEEIPLEELARAAFLNLQHALSLTEPDLIAQTARLVGYSRPGERVRARVQQALARLEAAGLLARRADKLELAHPHSGIAAGQLPPSNAPDS